MRIYLIVFAGGIVFAYGLGVGMYRIFPYQLLESTAAGVLDWVRYPMHNARLRPDKFLRPAQGAATDSVRGHSNEIYPGVTFVTGFFEKSLGMRLLDVDLQVVHAWNVSFNEIWPSAPHIDGTMHDWDAMIHGAVLYPNGDIVFNFQYAGLVRIDKCSRTRWQVPRQTHHSVFRDINGNLWVPSRRLREESVDDFPKVPVPFQEEYILVVSPDGEVLREISILDVLYASKYEGVMFASGAHDAQVAVPLDRDFTHLNDVEILGPEAAPSFPQFEQGDILVSLRNLNLLLILDGDDAAIKWSMVGPFLRQHDPDFLQDGRISVFDNRRDGANGALFGGSRILVIDPLTREITVRYGLDTDESFYTETMGIHQHLPNGNVLVTASESGHAFEAAENGEIVWSYVNRWDDEFVALIGQATRYPEDYRTSIQGESCR